MDIVYTTRKQMPGVEECQVPCGHLPSMQAHLAVGRADVGWHLGVLVQLVHVLQCAARHVVLCPASSGDAAVLMHMHHTTLVCKSCKSGGKTTCKEPGDDVNKRLSAKHN